MEVLHALSVTLVILINVKALFAAYCPSTDASSVVQVCTSGSITGSYLYIDTRNVSSPATVCSCSISLGGNSVQYIDYSGPGTPQGLCGIEFRFTNMLLSCTSTTLAIPITDFTYSQTDNSFHQACLTMSIDGNATVTCYESGITPPPTQRPSTTTTTTTTTTSTTTTTTTSTTSSTTTTTTTTTTSTTTTTTTSTTTTPSTTKKPTTTLTTTAKPPTTQPPTTQPPTTQPPTTQPPTTQPPTTQPPTTKPPTTQPPTTQPPTTQPPTTQPPTTQPPTTQPPTTQPPTTKPPTTKPPTTKPPTTTPTTKLSTRPPSTTTIKRTTSTTRTPRPTTPIPTRGTTESGSGENNKQNQKDVGVMIGIILGGLGGMFILAAIIIICIIKRKQRIKKPLMMTQYHDYPGQLVVNSSFSDDIVMTANPMYDNRPADPRVNNGGNQPATSVKSDTVQRPSSTSGKTGEVENTSDDKSILVRAAGPPINDTGSGTVVSVGGAPTPNPAVQVNEGWGSPQVLHFDDE